MKTYERGTQCVSFPLGDIGTGSIGLAGNGALVDWEIANRPNRQSINPYSGFAVKAEDESRVVDMRFLHGDMQGALMGDISSNHSWGYGHGPNRGTLCGMKHFEHTRFSAGFPFARVDFEDARFPGKVSLEAFNPFIPGNEDDSGIPAALFTVRFTNISPKRLRMSAALSVTFPYGDASRAAYCVEDGMKVLSHTSAGRADSAGYAQIALATDADNATHQSCWYRGGWFDDLTMFLNDFGAYGELPPREYPAPRRGAPDTCTLCASAELQSGESADLHFVLAWYAPVCVKYWDEVRKKPRWRNYYATLYKSAADAAKYALRNRERLCRESRLFSDALYGSSLPRSVLDAVEANLCTLKSTTCLRLEDGSFYAWEGVGRDKGSCEGTCQHVWNYAYALPLLFSRLERGVRQNELEHSLDACGRMHFRMKLPLGSGTWPFRACVDGQMGFVMKCYSLWKYTGDSEWLKKTGRA